MEEQDSDLLYAKNLLSSWEEKFELESEVGKGTTFTFSISTQTVEAPQTISKSRFGVKELEGKRVLVIDDNATNRDILEGQISKWKMIPYLCSNGPEALEWVENNPAPDIILIDFIMKGMDGVMLTKVLRKNEQLSDIPILLLSSAGRISKEVRKQKLFEEILTKPVHQSALLDAISRHLLQLPEADEKGERSKDPEAELAAEFPMRILVADDNQVNQKLIRRILEKMGYEPEIVSDGRLAIEKLEEQEFDLVFMDVQMPDLDGITATKYIRSQFEAHIQPIIVAMTANALVGDREKCLEAGMNDYISKPFQKDSGD